MSFNPDWAQPFLDANPDIAVFETFVVDVNGQARGKWIPRDTAAKALHGELRLPCSAFALDIWGHDVLDAGLVHDTGDNDGICIPVAHTLARIPWLDRPTAQLMMSMCNADGSAFFADPRQLLATVQQRLQTHGWSPVVATELEFYLVDMSGKETGPLPPPSPVTGAPLHGAQVYGISQMQEFEGFLTDLSRYAELQGLPADTAVSENGPGQYEINLNHVPDALMAADHAVLLKRVVKAAAKRHQLEATFMAKPYSKYSGNGLHIHFSLLDDEGRNIFAGADAKGSGQLRHAIGGLVQSMPDCMALFAPNANSYRRFRAGSHAPTTASWGYDNRSVALRVPDSDLAATRIEHRVPGADAHPHLVIAAILAGACMGLVAKLDPGPSTDGNAYESQSTLLPTTWERSLEIFEQSNFVTSHLGQDYQKVFSACKRQEQNIIDGIISEAEYDAYLRSV